MLKTVREVFISNLRRLRGDRSQPDTAIFVKLPFPTYRDAEYGAMPKDSTLEAIAKAYGLPGPASLFVDPDMQTGPVDVAMAKKQGAAELAVRLKECMDLIQDMEPEQWDQVREAIHAIKTPLDDGPEESESEDGKAPGSRSKSMPSDHDEEP